jgi:hypothetical protein
MVGQAGAGSSRTDQPQGTPRGGQRGLGSLSLPAPACQHPDQAPQPASQRGLLRTRGRPARAPGRPGVSAPRRPPGRLATLGDCAAALGQWRSVAFAGLDPVAAVTRRPPRPAPGHWLGAVPWSSFAVMGDHPEASAWQRREDFGVVGTSWHDSRIRNNAPEGQSPTGPVTRQYGKRLATFRGGHIIGPTGVIDPFIKT